ncbi:interferon alpha/beta receptor 2 [Ctenodactylus gundi]
MSWPRALGPQADPSFHALPGRLFVLGDCIKVCSEDNSRLTSACDEPCVFKMAFRNFRPILSWQLKNNSVVPTHYTLQYTIMSKLEDMKTIEECANITRSFCDLTEVWKEMHETYIPLVEGFKGQTPLLHCRGSIMAMNISFEPPDFEIVGFTNHINVTVKFPSVAPKIYEEEAHYYISLVINEQSGEIVKMHKPNMGRRSFSGNFSYVINNLISNTNYCISVYFEPRNMGTIMKSPLKCVLLQSGQESGSSKSAIVGGTITMLLVIVAVTTIVILKRIGYICFKNNLPKVLIFHSFVAQIFPDLPPMERVNLVEVIFVNRKKKVWNYNYGDESDSENEVVPRASTCGYTVHGLTGRLLSRGPASPTPSQDSQPEDPEAENSEEPDRETEPQPEPPTAPGPGLEEEHTDGPRERRGSPFHYASPGDDSSCSGGARDRITFNVNLNSVFLRVLDDDTEGNSEEATLELPPPEELMDPEEGPHETESRVLVTSGARTLPPLLGLSSECLWTGAAPSDCSNTSDDEDDDIRDGYIMR